jgi:hypothetical protein
MKFLPGLVVALIIGFGIVWSRGCGQTEDSPSREFTDLELVAADHQSTGTCYSLSTVLIATSFWQQRPVITWTRVNDTTWKHRAEGFADPQSGGQGTWWIDYTFEQRDQSVVITDYASSDSREYTPTQVIDALLEAPIDMKSTKVDRCLNGGSGYQPEKQSN